MLLAAPSRTESRVSRARSRCRARRSCGRNRIRGNPTLAYNRALGEGISRDPIEEKGGANLYGFVRNRTTRSIDPLGLFEIVGPEASIFSWIEAFNADFDDWDPFNEAYASAHGGEEPSYGIQTGIKIAVNELSISANPTPGRAYDSQTEETRGRLKMAVAIECCEKGNVSKARLSTLKFDHGYTPIRATAGGEVITYDPAEGKEPTVTGLKNLGGPCITVTVLHQSRVGKFDQKAAAVFTGTGVPWIGRQIEYTLCCNRKYSIDYSGTHFPSHKSYLNDLENGRWNQTDLANFMFTGDGVLAPMTVFHRTGAR